MFPNDRALRDAVYGCGEPVPIPTTAREQHDTNSAWHGLWRNFVFRPLFTKEEFLALPALFVAEFGPMRERGPIVDAGLRARYGDWIVERVKREQRWQKLAARAKQRKPLGINLRREQQKVLRAIIAQTRTPLDPEEIKRDGYPAVYYREYFKRNRERCFANMKRYQARKNEERLAAGAVK